MAAVEQKEENLGENVADTDAANGSATGSGDGDAPAASNDSANDNQTPATNGDTNPEPVEENKEGGAEESKGGTVKTVNGILAKVKNNPNMKDSDKIDTLCVLVAKILDENNMLKTDLTTMTDHISKASQANEAVKKLNSAYKQQIELVQEESQLKLKEEEVKRAECMKTYQSTMDELSTLLETHTDQNSRLRDENIGMADKLNTLCQEGEKREKQVVARLKEYELQIQLLEHQVMKAQLEKAEVKADMTQERLQLAQELAIEREKATNLEETARILKEQASIYQAQLDELSSGAGNSTKTFQHFKQQIDKLTQQLVDLDKDTHQWREKYEVSSQQVKKMNSQSMEREKEIGQLKKKLEQMVKLNKTLADERTSLNDKIKQLESKEA
eukprot:TRINITY_DN9273_c0_g1_i2.p1 TRINITY_DN9273_c0_g1~~TRINITY_DN9273_c0_g1_i2.p1  ORF type:complete len:387 (-),score=125.39 TRINITY_DN9273_c0_g1_i2:147-1307(-)